MPLPCAHSLAVVAGGRHGAVGACGGLPACLPACLHLQDRRFAASAALWARPCNSRRLGTASSSTACRQGGCCPDPQMGGGGAPAFPVGMALCIQKQCNGALVLLAQTWPIPCAFGYGWIAVRGLQLVVCMPSVRLPAARWRPHQEDHHGRGGIGDPREGR